MLLKTKLIVTVGPVGQEIAGPRGARPLPYSRRLPEFARLGTDVFRINMAFYPSRVEMNSGIRNGILPALRSIEKPIAIMADLGPKLRIAGPPEPVSLARGDRMIIHFHRRVPGTRSACTVVLYDRPFRAMIRNLSRAFHRQDEILIAIGEDDVVLSARRADLEPSAGTLATSVYRAGRLRGRKGITFRDVTVRFPEYLAPEARRQIDFLLQNCDERLAFIALSFVQEAGDLQAARRLVALRFAHYAAQGLAGLGYDRSRFTRRGLAALCMPMLIAKIETAEAVRNFDEILAEADGIMVARGDLGLQIGVDRVPALQKEIIRKCNLAGKPVITATQMLQSMTEHPTPTRAEAADVFNAVVDGSDALLLSNETSEGQFAYQAVEAACAIARQAEAFQSELGERSGALQEDTLLDASEQFSEAIARAAMDRNVKAVIAATTSGRAARLMSRFRMTRVPIIGAAFDKYNCRKLILSYAVSPICVGTSFASSPEMIREAVSSAVRAKLVNWDDRVVVTSGHPLFTLGRTNALTLALCRELARNGERNSLDRRCAIF